MFLYVRMAVYLISGALAGMGYGTMAETSYCWAESASCIDLDAVTQMALGLATFLGTFWASRIAKKKGGAT